MPEIIDYYNKALAVDATGTVLRSAEANVYALADTSFSSPLPITDLQGVPMDKLRSSSEGVYPEFRVPSGELQIVVKSGTALTPMMSLGVFASTSQAAAVRAEAAAAAVAGSANAAEEARQAAETARAAAEAVGTTNDEVIANLIAAPNSQARVQIQEVVTLSVGGQQFTLIEDPDREGTFVSAAAGPVDPDPAVPAMVTTANLAAMTQGVGFTQTLTATGDLPISWSITAGSLPNGLTLNASTGVISGTPTVSGSYSVTVRASNQAGNNAKQFTGTVTASGTAPTISTTQLNPLTQNVAFTQTLTAAGSTPIAFAVSSGTLPAGLSLSSGGVISGTPSGSGAYNFTVTASNSFGNTPRSFTGTITAASSGGGGGSVGTRVKSYGPNGSHWSANFPKPGDTFSRTVSVAPTWSAIQAQIDNPQTTGTLKIEVEPGAMPVGFGNGSTRNPVLYGQATPKILIVPRDGYGSVTMNTSSTLSSMGTTGYSFALQNIAMAGFNFQNAGVILRSSTNAALMWSTFGVLNVTANERDSSALELVECVLPNQIDSESDHSATRVANGYSVLGLTYSGCYFAPAYKANGSSSHCDTIQFSSTRSGGFDNILFEDTILFQSSSQTLQLATVDTVNFRHSAFIGGLRATGRFPIGSGRHVMVGQNTLWGGAQDAHSEDGTVVMGSINSSVSFSGVTNSVCSTQTFTPPGWTINPAYDGQSTLQTAWINANSPAPTAAYLASIWAAI